MLKVGLKKEIMFFCRSFRMWGVIIAVVVLSAVSPLLMKLSAVFVDSLTIDMTEELYNVSEVNEDPDAAPDYSVQYLSDSEGFAEDYAVGDDYSAYFAAMGIASTASDMTNTVMLIFMLVTMYTAGGELKKRSLIIPRNAGLTSKLYLLPKFLFYPVFAALAAFCGIMISFGLSCAIFGSVGTSVGGVLWAALCAAVYNAFITALYLTLGLCTAKAGLSVVIIYAVASIVNSLSVYMDIGRFHPFTFLSQAQDAVIGQETHTANLLGSIAITLVLMTICYFVTLFVSSVKRVDNIGAEEMNLL